jgi:hypothetical protein
LADVLSQYPPNQGPDVQVLVNPATGIQYERMIKVEELTANARSASATFHALRVTVSIAPTFTIRLANGLRWLVPVIQSGDLQPPELR